MNKEPIQESQYSFPYHHLVGLDGSIASGLLWGLEYLAYMRFLCSIPVRGIVADVGCGDGKLSIELARKNLDIKVHGFDISDRAIGFANAFSLPNTWFASLNINEIVDTYDYVFCVETLEHIPSEEMPNFVKALKMMVKPGGRLIVSVPTHDMPFQKKHYRHYNLQELEKEIGQVAAESKLLCSSAGDWLQRFVANKYWFLRGQFFVDWYMDHYQFGEDGKHLVAIFDL